METECLHTIETELLKQDNFCCLIFKVADSSACSNLLLDPSITLFILGCYKLLIIIICKATTKKITFKMYRRGKKKGVRVAHTKTTKSAKYKEGLSGGIGEQNPTRQREQLNSLSTPVLISSHIKCKWVNSPVKRQRLHIRLK